MTLGNLEKPVLLVGGYGKTGRRVAERLEAQGVLVRVGSRSSEPAFDWNDRATWAAALKGARAAYITYYPDLSVPGAAAAVAAFTEAALDAGVRRLVLLSGRGEEEAEKAEQALKASGADWTVVRCAWFNQNFSENFLLDPILAGVVALPVDGVREPFVDADDIADVVAAALTEDGHAGKLHELTGPRLLTFGEAIAEIAAATGRKIRLEQISAGEFSNLLVAEGVPDSLVELIMVLFTQLLDGRNQSLAGGVAEALGRPPRDFADFARDAAETGIWTPRRTRRAVGGVR
ncbi:NAD(P)H-binding protein [Mesorhizobium sp. LHD-90]|uniref:NAD(P)H-binding protein n=1 Tax=Mesorhizobium sp. LHD-90 TaxID=3071414 RepID=UPI0027DF452E|nr:NAD(P)H-binding protein [Mesorhizobium sp. LHD-90]MDQ6435497.1 NAD(P)H-binding protein [Mesorhizobium sp. LHD-90]